MRKRFLLAAALALALAAAASAAACGKTRTTCADPPEKPRELDEVDESIRSMSEAARRDPSLCQELRTPRIALVDENLVLTGVKTRRIAGRLDLPAKTIAGIPRLQANIASFRSQLRLIGAAGELGEVDMKFDPALETPRAASVILSAVYGGYERARVTSGATTVPVVWWRRGPPDSRYTESILHVEAASETTVTVHVRGPVCARSTALTVETKNVSELVARLCKEHKRGPSSWEFPQRYVTRCVDSVELRVLPTSRFGATAVLLRSIVTALADQQPTVEIALLLAGSEPAMKDSPKSYWPGISMFAPAPDSWAHCTLPDGGYEQELRILDAGLD